MAKRSTSAKELSAIVAREDSFRKLLAKLRPGLAARYVEQYGVTLDVASRCRYGAVLETVLLDFRDNLEAADEMALERLPVVASHYRIFLDQCAAINPDAAYNAEHAEKFMFIMRSAIDMLRDLDPSKQHKVAA